MFSPELWWVRALRFSTSAPRLASGQRIPSLRRVADQSSRWGPLLVPASHTTLNTRREVVSTWRERFCRDRPRGRRSSRARAGPAPFPPDVVVEIKRIACELPSQTGVPLSRLHVRHPATGSGAWLGRENIEDHDIHQPEPLVPHQIMHRSVTV